MVPFSISDFQALIGVAFSVGFILGPMLGAYFSSTSRSIRYVNSTYFRIAPAQIAIYITIIELFLVIFLMSETLESSKRVSFIFLIKLTYFSKIEKMHVLS